MRAKQKPRLAARALALPAAESRASPAHRARATRRPEAEFLIVTSQPELATNENGAVQAAEET